MIANRYILAVAAWCGACSTGDEARLGVQSASLVFAEDSGTGCVTPMSLRGGLPAGVDRMVVRVVRESDGQVAAARVVTAEDLVDRREVLLTGVPEGAYRLEVAGCGGDGPVWGGRSEPFRVHPGFKSAPIVHLARAGALNCAGGKNQNPLQPKFDGDGFYVMGRAAFQGAVATPDGRVFVTGGFATDEYRATGDTLKAGRRVWEYHPETGIFTGVFSPSGERFEITEPRAVHGVAAVTVGGTVHLVLAGGVASAVLGPSQYPVSLAPLDLATAVQSPIEVLAIPAAGSADAPSARSIGLQRPVAAFPSWAFSADGRTVCLAGGKDTSGVSNAVTMVTLSDEALEGTAQPEVRSGTLTARRFGAAVVLLSTREVALIGGSDGSGPSGIEWVRPSGDNALESVAVTAGLPEGVEPTAFASVAVVKDDGTSASLLVLGGNPLPSGATAYDDPDSANAWLLEVDGDGQTYDPASARTRAVSGAGDWASRSLAGLVRAGGRFLLFGGFRSFDTLPVDGCGTGGPVWGVYCFPRTIQAFTFDATTAQLTPIESLEDVKSRLGVASVVLSNRQVLLLGGLDGFGTRPIPLPPDFDPLLSTGLIWAPEDAFDPAACQVPSVP